ncbi:MAG TPA: T9SS type A sorting domain-containing protein [Bacteroidia bacterium]|nr:T9SS type A sorting domain-containing protein [Bacteroidia bacterium]
MKTFFTCLLFTLLASASALSQVENFNNSNFTIHHNQKDDSSKPSENEEKNKYRAPLKIQAMVPAIWFDEHPVTHNMHITSDGNYFYTVNGGSSSTGQINKFDLTGTLIQTYPIQISGRGISYNYPDGFLYASIYGGDVIKITDLNTGTYTTLFPGAMQNDQASFAISVDGTKFYDFYSGTLLIHNFNTGAVINTITGLSYGSGNFGGDAAVAVDSNHIYTWDATIKTVYVYDTAGTFIQTMPLDSGDNGHSLSIASHYLFVARDGNYAVGTWYGYDLSQSPNFISEPEKNLSLNIYPNPTHGKVIINNNNLAEAEVYNYLGEKIYLPSRKNPTSCEIDFSNSPNGIYFLKINDRKNTLTKKIVVQ